MQKGPPLSGWPLTCCFVEAARRIELLYRALQVPISGSVAVRRCPSMQVRAFRGRGRTALNVGGCVVRVWSDVGVREYRGCR